MQTVNRQRLLKACKFLGELNTILLVLLPLNISSHNTLQTEY